MACVKGSVRTALLWGLLATLVAGAEPPLAGTRHRDGRGTAKLVLPPSGGSVAGSGRQAAEAYLQARSGEFGLPADLAALELVTRRESLLGTHFRYRQVLRGLPVLGGDLVVSVSRSSGAVYQVYNNTYPVTVPPALPKALIGAERALDAAWEHLRVQGRLLQPLRAEMAYVPAAGGFRLVYRTFTAVAAPFGFWEHQIDAVSGEVTAVRDTVLRERKNGGPAADLAATTGPAWPRADAVRAWDAARTPRQPAPAANKSTVDGSALVFDGDPRTTLAAETLVDSSPAAAFAGAYVTRVLRDISFSAGVYALVGPWVQVVDFEAPYTVPSTSATGQWTATRGNNAFNDAMTYFHIDQNQRYLQSLGYTGVTGIQYGPIQADADGANGVDNSWYIPATNRLSFGHGGVDDNEDADVILHEYGHALTFDIVPTWGGGDSGAIGEGYGDYWGASYSYTTTNGTTFHPAWAFSWDGHSADTWTGRFLDMTSLTYNPAHTYVAHETISGIPNYSDQLWGTPLFQSFLALLALGVPRSDVDRIVVEAYFGIGANPTLRDMATATVNTAALLFPAGPHAVVFREAFMAPGILLPDPGAPSGFVATPVSTSRIDLSWARNPSNHNVIVAWNTSAAFGVPAATSASGDAIVGGGTVLYNGSATTVAHSGLPAATTYSYKAWSVTGPASLSTGVSCSASTVRGIPFAEGFENAGEIPAGWTQEIVSGAAEWAFQNGGMGGFPPAAHGGDYNALLFFPASTDNRTRLVTPALDLGASGAAARLRFWHSMPDWEGDQDQLRVYYKTAAAGPWTLITGATYTTSVTAWTQRTLTLPTPNRTYYIAFEGNAKYGFGVALDDVEVRLADGNVAPLIAQGAAVAAVLDEDGTPSAWSTPLIQASDADGDPLTWSKASGPSHGSATVSGTGATPSISYAPAPNWNGSDSFVAQVADGNGHSAAITLNVTVTPRNDPPVNTVLPSVTGTYAAGQVLTAGDGSWDDSTDVTPGTLAFARQWRRADDASGTNAADLSAATGETYTVQVADRGAYLSLRVTATDDGEGVPPDPARSRSADSAWVRVPDVVPAAWTFMVYLDADNDLEAAAIADFLEMAAVGSNAGLNIVVLFDRTPGYSTAYADWTDTRRGLVLPGATPTAAWGTSVGEKNMGDGATVTEFVNWAMTDYPAERYALVFWNHGGGWRSQAAKAAAPVKAVCWDTSSGGDALYTRELQQALDAAAAEVTLLGFDACLMGMAEVAYQLRHCGAGVMVASQENEPLAGWPYDLILADLQAAPATSAAQLGTLIVDRYYASTGDTETQSAIDLTRVEALAAATSTLADTLVAAWDTDAVAVKAAAQAVLGGLAAVVIHNHAGAAVAGAHGLSINFPTTGKDAAYTAVDIAFAADTSWDEFLDAFAATMADSWIAQVRSVAQSFGGLPFVDLHDFCSRLVHYTPPVRGYTEIQQDTSGFSAGGAPLDWQADEGAWSYALPFAFPFYGTSYSNVTVSSNGFLDFGAGVNDYSNSTAELVMACRIAPLWDDLDTRAGNIYIHQPTPTSVCIRWQATLFGAGGVVNVAVILHQDGRIRFHYGSGNRSLTPTVGLSAGTGSLCDLSAYYNGQATLTEARSLVFVPAGNPRPSVSFTTAAQSAGEAVGAVTVTAQLSGAYGLPVSVPCSVGGTAQASPGPGQDVALASTVFVIPAGELTADLTVTVLDDALDEGDETVTLTMGAPTNATLGVVTVQALTVVDDDATPVIAQGASVSGVMDEDGAPNAWSAPLIQAADADGDPLTWSLAGASSHGSAAVSGSGGVPSISYTPSPDWNGSDHFVAQVSDGNGNSAQITVNVSVLPRNDPPQNTVLPGVSGTPRFGQTLQVSEGAWNDTRDTALNGASALQVVPRWQRAADANGTHATDIPGASAGAYVLATADVGRFVRALVTASDDGVGEPVSASAAVATPWLSVAQATPLLNWASPAALIYGTALGAAQLNATADVPGTFAYAPPAGTVLAAGSHTLQVDFTPADTVSYASATATVSLTVDPAAPGLGWASPAALIYGTALGVAQLNATADVPGTFAYTPPAGTMLGAGAHTLRVAFTPADALNYVAASTTVSLTVDPATPALSWASPAALIYGPALGVAQLNATADVPGTFAYTPPAGTVLAAGAHTLRVDFTPADALNYVAASSSVSLTVDPATPALSWASPAALIYGTALGVAQLNATADVPGTFAYTPAAGTMLGAGAHTLRVAFTPADALNYVAASTTVSLTVDPATPALSWASPAALTYGTALGVAQLKATADVPGTFAYTPPTGTMLVAGSHTLRVAFTPADALNHVAASTTVSLTVDPSVLTITAASVSRAYHTANPALAWTVAGFANGDTAGVLVGEPLLSCTATLDSSVADGPYAIAVTSGTLTAANYSFACVPGALTVVRATPEIIWPAPAPLEYGTGLSALQLNATANTAGTFTYTPPVGTRLDRGPHLLAASFAPADVANWTSASAEPRTLAVVDTTAAWVTTLAPATAAVGVARDAALVLTFSEPVLPGTGAVRIMDEAGGVFAILAVDGRGAVTIDGSRVTIAHAPFAAGRAYHVLVASTCFRDLAGNAFAGIADPGAWAFTVRPWYVTFAAGEFGTLAGGESAVTVAVKQGDPLSAVPPVTPVEGWRFVDWEPLLPAALSADLLVTAQYARRVWTVAYAAAAPGRIDGAALQAVPHGASATAVAAIAGFGDVFDHWSDGRTDSPRTDTNVVADLELTAIFRAAAGVAPNGSFLARCAAPAAATGQGFWDLTGDYSLTLNGNPLLLHLLHDPRGRLTGTARLNVATGTTVVPLSLSVRGTFGGAGTVRRATLVLQGTNAARTVGADLTLVLTLDAEARQLRGPATGSLRSGAVSSPVAAVVTLALPLAMDGTWTLLLELVAGGRGVTGRALLTLANGVDYAFVVTGRRQGAAVLLNLAGGPADPAARSFEVTTTITALEGRQARLDAFSGRGHGQVVQW